MKATNPITGEKMKYRTLAWAKDNGYINDENDLHQVHTNPYVIDCNESCFVIKVQETKYLVKR